MRKVLLSDFGIWPVLTNVAAPSEALIRTQEYWSRLANYLLLYDQLVIPTGNLQVLPVLRLMLGERTFDELVRTKVLVFARYDQWFAYGGNGAGIVFFRVLDNPENPRVPNLGTSYYKPLDEMIATALVSTKPDSTAERRRELTNLLIDNVVELPTKEIADELPDETYRDVLGSPYLREQLALRNAGRSIKALRGLNPNQLSVFSPHVAPQPTESPEIRSVLRAAFENFLLAFAGQAGVTEIVGDDSTLSLLRAKGQRLGYSLTGTDAFTTIQELHGVPDIGVAFATRVLSGEKLLALRSSPNAQAFRDWFRTSSGGRSDMEVVRRFIQESGEPSFLESLPGKTLRLVVTTAVGLANAGLGLAASGVDTFLLEKWFRGDSPKLFLRQAKVMLASNPRIPEPRAPRTGRNDACPCGSGRKYKKCCGA